MEENERNLQVFRVSWAIISMIITALSQALNIFSIWPQAPWSIFALGSFVVFCVFVWILIANLQMELNSKIPNIYISGEPITNDIGMGYPKKDGSFETVAISNMAGIAFANNPKPRTDKNNANSVRAEITYLDDKRTILIGPIQGRWGETLQPSEIKRSETPLIESVDFPNNGANRSLAFLIKYPEDDYCYAFNNESYNYGYLFQNPSYAIKSERFIVQIKLLGAYIPDKPWEFEVITEGKGDTYKIRYDDKWIKTENRKATRKVVPTKKELLRIKSLKSPKLST